MLHILETRMRNSTKKYHLTGSIEYYLLVKSCQTIATPFYSLSKPHYRWYHEKINNLQVWDTTDPGQQEQGRNHHAWSNLDVPHIALHRHLLSSTRLEIMPRQILMFLYLCTTYTNLMISGCQTCSTAPNRVFSGISEETYQHSWKKISDWNMFVPSRWFIQLKTSPHSSQDSTLII